MAVQVRDVSRWTAGPTEEAFDRLFVTEYRRVVDIAYRILNDSDEAEDVAQETFASFFGQHDPSASFAPAWLHRAAAHLALNAIRSRKRRVARERREAVQNAPVAVASEMWPDVGAERKEERVAVRVVLARIPKRSAKILALRYSGLSYAEVAEAMNCKVGDVGTMLRRAEAAFRKEFTNETR